MSGFDDDEVMPSCPHPALYQNWEGYTLVGNPTSEFLGREYGTGWDQMGGRAHARTHAETVERYKVNGVNAWPLAGGGNEAGIPIVERQKARTSPGSSTPLERADWKGTLRAPMQDVG